MEVFCQKKWEPFKNFQLFQHFKWGKKQLTLCTDDYARPSGEGHMQKEWKEV